jgi:hypothetical protein
LRARFWVAEPGRGRLDGRYELNWRNPTEWRELIDYPDHHQITGQDGATAWIATERPYQALRLLDLGDAIDVASHASLQPGSAIEKTPTAKTGGTSTLQIRTKQPGRFSWAEFSIDRSTGALVRFETGPAQTASLHYRTVHVYSDFRKWHDREFPGVIKRFDGKRQVLEIRVEEISDWDASDILAVVPTEGAVGRPICTAQELAASLKCDAGHQHFTFNERVLGNTAARAVVARDGRVHDVVIVESAGAETDGILTSYLEGWRCIPLTCGGVPVDSQVFEVWTFDTFN